METIFPIVGIALCAIVLVQLGLWTSQSLARIGHDRKQFALAQDLLRKEIEAAVSGKEIKAVDQEGSWNGFRPFRVAKVVKETDFATSVYLRPMDNKPICDFKPGQHLTLKFDIPGQSKPIVRCYSLSQGPSKSAYRITVKAVPAPGANPNVPPGRVSNFINRHLMAGDLVEAKAPSGQFVLDTETTAPVCLLAGGIGITPMISMIDYILDRQPDRTVILIYGSRHGADHTFKSNLQQIKNQYSNVYVIDVYSNPLKGDVQGQDYLVPGYVSAELIQQVLPHSSFQFYLCGPPPFMESVFKGLTDWGVPESRIRFEAFGPASIGKNTSHQATVDSTVEQNAGVKVSYASSGKQAIWKPTSGSLLELAEETGVEIDSGCRAGSCGTCETKICVGKVKYPNHENVDCKPGHCLTCIAQPDGPLELEA